MSYLKNMVTGLPPVTKNIIIINLLMWLGTLSMERVGINLHEWLGLHYLLADKFQPWQLVSYMFVHSYSFDHVLFNMFAVFMFGATVEQTWGSKKFLVFYLITGMGAGLIQELAWTFDYREIILGNIDLIQTQNGIISTGDFLNRLITVGASGSVFGILLAFGMLFPDARLFIMFIPYPVKAKYVVIGYGLLELFQGVANFSFDNVAHFAHLGGMLFGFILIKYWQKR